jgi:PhoH-like ATPase
MKKTFILDTNVLLHDPRAMFSFGDNNIIIPIYAVEEIDNFKKSSLNSAKMPARLAAFSMN